jgi:hypothetical protein
LLLLLDGKLVLLLRLRLLQVQLHLLLHDVALSELRLPLLLLAISGRLGTEFLLVSLSSGLLCALIGTLLLGTASKIDNLLGFLLGISNLFPSLLFFKTKQTNAIREQNGVLLRSPSGSVCVEERAMHVGHLGQVRPASDQTRFAPGRTFHHRKSR